MKNKYLSIIVLLGSLLQSNTANATYVDGGYRKDGSYVQGHYRSDRNDTVKDNYSYHGNSNPHTGASGTNNYIHDRTSDYYQGSDNKGRTGHSDRNNNYSGYLGR